MIFHFHINSSDVISPYDLLIPKERYSSIPTNESAAAAFEFHIRTISKEKVHQIDCCWRTLERKTEVDEVFDHALSFNNC